MTLQSEVSLLDRFTYTNQDHMKIATFDFIRENSTSVKEKVMIDETFCTLVAVGEIFSEKSLFKKILKKIDEIRNLIRP